MSKRKADKLDIHIVSRSRDSHLLALRHGPLHERSTKFLRYRVPRKKDVKCLSRIKQTDLSDAKVLAFKWGNKRHCLTFELQAAKSKGRKRQFTIALEPYFGPSM